MKSRFYRTAAPLITKIDKLFNEDLAKENDFLRQENKILRSKLGKQVLLHETDRRTLLHIMACASKIDYGRSFPSSGPKHCWLGTAG